MTAFFSTGEQSTAITALGAVVAWPAAALSVVVSVEVAGGAQAALESAFDLAPELGVGAGGRLDVEGLLATGVDLSVATGAATQIDTIEWAFSFDDFVPGGGGYAGLVTDVLLWFQPSTAEAATTEGPSSERLRLHHTIQMRGLEEVQAGAETPVAAVMASEPNTHGPVARVRRVAGQIIMN